MADILPRDLPAAPNVPGQSAIIVDNGIDVEKATPAQLVNAGRPNATTAEAVAGSDTTKSMTPATTREAILALSPLTSGNVAGSLADLKAYDINKLIVLYDSVPWEWTPGDFSNRPASEVDVMFAQANGIPLSTGAWVRQEADKVASVATGVGAVTRTVQDDLRNLGRTPEGYGAVGDGLADDTLAVQRALNAGGSVRLPPGKSYRISSKLTITQSGTSLTGTGGGKLVIDPDWDFAADTDGGGTHMRVIFVEALYTTISDVVFDATGVPGGTAVENGFIWSTSAFTSIRNCIFIGCPKGTSIWGLSPAPYMSVIGNTFSDCTGAVFFKGRNSICSDNIIVNAVDAAIAINGLSCVGAVVSNNTISNDALAAIPSMIAVEEGAANWTITGNTMQGVNGGGIVAVSVLDETPAYGGIIANNIIDGARGFDGELPETVNPASLLHVNQNYFDVQVVNNMIRNCPTGNSASRLAIIPATGTLFADNIIDGSSTPGLSAMIEIAPGTKGMTIKDNRSEGATGVRHYLFGAGSYGSVPCTFIGGKMYGGSEGINSELNAGGITNFLLHIENITEASMASVVNAATAIGDRATFLNAGAWARPHKIGVFTEMHGNAIPAAAGAIPYQVGDKFYLLAPASGGFIGYVRIPGNWVDFGAVT